MQFIDFILNFAEKAYQDLRQQRGDLDNILQFIPGASALTVTGQPTNFQGDGGCPRVAPTTKIIELQNP